MAKTLLTKCGMALNTVDKVQLRNVLLAQRSAIPPEQRATINAAICRRVLGSEVYRIAGTLFIYWSTEDEIDTHTIVSDALRQGKRVCIPKCLPGHCMEPRQILSEQDLTEETFGIAEPGVHCTPVPPSEIDLCIIPALACDRTGARLGYGGGFYDRFLPQTAAYRMVLCTHERILPQLPVQPLDVRCACIITEQEVMLIDER
ncbi:MAG: 5-formyltetrahydrofolate cyclo-ligase [Eubacteriales bacterium]|nr:5-formyltetrahydrofolate cyclo-ligase [Eubacteriales bacterium]